MQAIAISAELDGGYGGYSKVQMSKANARNKIQTKSNFACRVLGFRVQLLAILLVQGFSVSRLWTS